MRQLITVVIVGSIFAVAIALLARTDAREDDLSRSISQMVETSR